MSTPFMQIVVFGNFLSQFSLRQLLLPVFHVYNHFEAATCLMSLAFVNHSAKLLVTCAWLQNYCGSCIVALACVVGFNLVVLSWSRLLQIVALL